MKRIDMIKRLGNLLERLHDKNGDLFDFYSVADLLLEEMEDAGMLPPDSLPSALSLSTKEWKVQRDQYIQDRYSWDDATFRDYQTVQKGDVDE